MLPGGLRRPGECALAPLPTTGVATPSTIPALGVAGAAASASGVEGASAAATPIASSYSAPKGRFPGSSVLVLLGSWEKDDSGAAAATAAPPDATLPLLHLLRSGWARA
eukprot:354899-Alexandrium_andersonii.AAC.1